MRVKVVGLVLVLASLLATTAAQAFEGAPASFTLTAKGSVSQGVTVKPVLRKPRVIGLIVFKQPNHAEVGTVPLGRYSDHPSIHWNLEVGGKLLGSGSYEIYLKVFANGHPTNIPGPPPRRLVISGHHVHVS